MHTMKILAIDIGGTKSALGQCTIEGTKVTKILGLTKFASSDFRSLPSMVTTWCKQNPELKFDAIGAGVAGPVIDGRVHLTNLGWSIDSDEMEHTFHTPFKICNDMESHGWGLLGLEASGKFTINPGSPGPGAMALIAAGTGLGEAIIGWNGKTHHPMPGEGGHASFSPTNPIEDELLLYLRREYPEHVSWERVLGGRDGFRNLSRFLAGHRKTELPAYLGSLPSSQFDWGEPIIKANAAGDPFASDVVALYATLYGREAANLAVKCVPRQGVFLGGGVAPRISNDLQKYFMRGFTDKGRFSELLKSIPVFVIMDDVNGLKGAAIQCSVIRL